MNSFEQHKETDNEKKVIRRQNLLKSVFCIRRTFTTHRQTQVTGSFNDQNELNLNFINWVPRFEHCFLILE